VVQTFLADDEMQAKFMVDAVVTVVDAKHIPSKTARRPRSRSPSPTWASSTSAISFHPRI
jgi:G3E family GTPase